MLAIWHGGLSSFGGLLFAVPTGLVLTRRRCPELPIGRALDLVAPVLMAAWAMGRLLGPQLMVAGGGHPTHQWFGMYYAGQNGRRLPVPLFQAAEDFGVYVVLILIERRLDRWPDGSVRTGYPAGTVIGTAMVLWGIERALDEHLWLGEDGHLGSLLVQIAGVLLVVGGGVVLLRTRRRWQEWRQTHHAPGRRAAVSRAMLLLSRRTRANGPLVSPHRIHPVALITDPRRGTPPPVRSTWTRRRVG